MVVLARTAPDELTDELGGEAQARSAKSSTAFRTISEVADDLDVAQHVLRFWESKFPQVRPLKRGGGRRYYRPEDIELLRQIRSLLYEEGYTIKGAQKLLRGRRSRAGAARESEPGAAIELPPAAPAPAGAPRDRLGQLRAELIEIRSLLAQARSWLR